MPGGNIIPSNRGCNITCHPDTFTLHVILMVLTGSQCTYRYSCARSQVDSIGTATGEALTLQAVPHEVLGSLCRLGRCLPATSMYAPTLWASTLAAVRHIFCLYVVLYRCVWQHSFACILTCMLWSTSNNATAAAAHVFKVQSSRKRTVIMKVKTDHEPDHKSTHKHVNNVNRSQRQPQQDTSIRQPR